MIKTILHHYIFDKFLITIFDGLIKEFSPVKSGLFVKQVGEYVDMQLNDSIPFTCEIIELNGSNSAKLRYTNYIGSVIFHVTDSDVTFIEGSMAVFTELLYE